MSASDAPSAIALFSVFDAFLESKPGSRPEPPSKHRPRNGKPAAADRELVRQMRCEFEHRCLVAADRHGGGGEAQDVRSLRGRIDGEAGVAGAVALLPDLGLHRGIPEDPLERDQIEEQHRYLGEFRDLRLETEAHLRGIEAHGGVVDHHLLHGLADAVDVVGVVGERLQVGHQDRVRADVLAGDPRRQRTRQMPQVERTGRPVAGQDDVVGREPGRGLGHAEVEHGSLLGPDGRETCAVDLPPGGPRSWFGWVVERRRTEAPAMMRASTSSRGAVLRSWGHWPAFAHRRQVARPRHPIRSLTNAARRSPKGRPPRRRTAPSRPCISPGTHRRRARRRARRRFRPFRGRVRTSRTA